MTQRVRIVRTKNQFAQNRKFLKGIMALCDYLLKPYEAQRKIEMHQERILTSQQKRKINELEEGIRSNKLTLLDIEIERKKLELEKLRRELGDANDFRPSLDEREE